MKTRTDEQTQQSDTRMKRRGILAAAGAVVAGIVAKQTAMPVAAANVTLGTLNTEAATTTFYLPGPSTAAALVGTADTGIGVQGTAYNLPAVYGTIPGASGASNTIAIQGVNQATGAGNYGMQGSSALSHGVVGLSGSTPGVSGMVAVGQFPGTVGFQGVAQGGATFAGYFFGDVSINKRISDGLGGNLGVAGSKFAIVKGADGKYRGMYAVESPECWFEDVGEGKIVAGKAEVSLDPLFLYHVHADTYHVFLTPHDADQHLAVTARSVQGFSVEASASAEAVAKGKTAASLNGTFSYRIMGKRNDIKGDRMPIWEMPQAQAVVPPKSSGTASGASDSSPQVSPPSRPSSAASSQSNPQSPVQPAPPPRP
jgi:hypothetical protein